jgi:murein DD-endopeptidase MepM/ murein hydrolase activator NlpD
MFSNHRADQPNPTPKRYLAAGLITLVFLISGCSQSAVNCKEQPYADLSEALTYAVNDQLPFQYPLDELGLEPYRDQYGDHTPARFCRGSWEKEGEEHKRKYHAAEDYHLPAGSPVYAFADGEISFSGRMGGYGWLIIIDHPQFNIYSLYGHLSPSRWYLESGTVVEKGDLIAYLGDSDENGGSEKEPLVTHLHFGIRAGQRTEYSGQGEWRWMAGWIKPCPSDLGWLQPSLIITGQEIPAGGFPMPNGSFYEKWKGEIILGGIYLIVGLSVGYNSWKAKKPLFLIFYSCAMIAGGWYFSIKATRAQYALYALAVVGLGVALYQFLQGRKAEPGEGEGESA